MRRRLQGTFEESLVAQLRATVEAYNKIAVTIRRPTNSAEDVEFLEKYV
jgi:hypothetical protein